MSSENDNDEDKNSTKDTKYDAGVNKNSRIIIRNISFKTTEEDLRSHFGQFGSIKEVSLLKKPDGKLVGCAFVHYQQVPMAKKAIIACNKKQFLGRPIYVTWAVSKDKYDENKAGKQKKEFKKGTSNDKKDKEKEVKTNRKGRLIIRNISFKASEESLREHFTPYGEINEIKLLKKSNGKLVGCAFVQFINYQMAKNALLATNMKPYLGRPISVDWAVAKDKYMRHVEEQRLELENLVKKEELSDDEGGETSDVHPEVKDEIKSEDESDDGEQEDTMEDDTASIKSEQLNESNDEDEMNDEDESDDEDVVSQTSESLLNKRKRLNDAEDGNTVFVTNIPFSVDNDKFKMFAEKFGPIKYALICIDQLTEHSKGSGFIMFENEDDADRFLVLEPEQLTLEGQVLNVKMALKKENLGKAKKQPKDSRNLYLVKEGVIVAGTKAAIGVSASDMAKRLALERSKTQMLKNLNRFVSRYRIVVQNLPAHYDDVKLRRLCEKYSPKNTRITEARVMRDLRAPLDSDGKHPSKGYGFVMFMRHEDALICLRKLNNNPDIFDKNNRPIVSFSIEDRAALNARTKRLEKSIANNPTNKQNENTTANNRNKNRKRKLNPEENKPGQFVKPLPNDYKPKFKKNKVENENYTGLTARKGLPQKLRSNYKLNVQAEVHRQNVKMEKKQSKKTLKLKMAAKERIKLPKMKQKLLPKSIKNNSNIKGRVYSNVKVVAKTKDTRNFNDLVSKYKSKLVGGTGVKAKWYE